VSLVEAPVLDAAKATTQAVTRARTVETLEATWAAWADLRAHRRTLLRQVDDERRRIDEQGALLLNAARLVTGPGAGDQLAVDPFADARAQLAAARAALDRQQAEVTFRCDDALGQLRATLLERVRRHAAQVPPMARLMVRVLSEGRRILHLQRPQGDEPVLLLYALGGRVPSRYEFLFDDSTDDPTLDPPSLYAEEGVDQPRTAPGQLQALLDTLPTVWPVKGMLPQVEAGRLFRWRARGPVLEAELVEADAFRNLLSTEEAELLTAGLLRRKLAGTLGFELSRG
jgi:DnaJ-domain-containing protein 1